MIRSLKRYARFFLVTFFRRKERRHLQRDAADWCFFKKFKKATFSHTQKQQALKDAVGWLHASQDAMQDGGFGTYYITDGWSSSYPETSGYIIPTLLGFDKNNLERSICCADWLISIQKPGGGWQSMYVADNRPEVVFNTGQVIRGLVAVYEHTSEQKYLDACVRACDWLCSIQEADGSWQKHAFMDRKRVYDTYVDHPLLMIWKLTGNEKYRSAAVRNLNWVIHEKQKANGWFEDCDNTIKHNARPILHTVSYTIDGLINSGLLLQDDRYIKAGQKAADRLLDVFNVNGWLNGRWDENWNGSEHLICTGCAQISIIWLILYRITADEKYKTAAARMNSQLVFIQQRGYSERIAVKGALTGSYPLWGKYEPFGFPNWATKYFADALMLELE